LGISYPQTWLQKYISWKESDTPTKYQLSTTHCCKNINQEWNNNREDKPGRRSCTLAWWRTRAHMACARTYEADSFSQNMWDLPSQQNPNPWCAQCSLTLKFKFEAPIFSSLGPKSKFDLQKGNSKCPHIKVDPLSILKQFLIRKWIMN
jgi:hypothetical protein